MSTSSEPITVGSSDVAAILGLSPWAGPWDAWSRLTGLVPRYDATDTKSQARGRMFEPAILTRYALEQGLGVMPGPPIGAPPLVGPEPWMHARPDGWAHPVVFPVSPDMADRAVEAKSARKFDVDDWGPPGTDEVPSWYAVQVVWILAVTGLDRCDLAAYSAIDDDWRVYHIARDRGIEGRVVARVRAWVERHVVGGAPPEVDGTEACHRVLARRWTASHRDHQAMAEEAELIARALRLRATIADLEGELSESVARLQARMGDADTLVLDGDRVATWRARNGARRVDLERLRLELPDVANKYTIAGQPGRTWRWT